MAAASVVCSVALGLGLWFWDSGQKQFSVADLLQRIDIQQKDAAAFDKSFDFQPPAGWSHDDLFLGDVVQGQDLDGEAGHEVARLDFFLRRPGTIIAIPANRVDPPPSSTSFSGAVIQYLPNDFKAVVWRAGDLVYVVMISGKPADLEYLQRSFSRIAA